MKTPCEEIYGKSTPGR